jgi:hypothetical protein
VDNLARCLLHHFLPFGMLTDSTHADTFSQERLDPEKQFQNFAHGIASHSFFPFTVIYSDVLVIVQIFLY